MMAVRQPTWSDWENGKKIPGTLLAVKLEKITGGFVPVSSWAVPSSAAPAAE
jgi:hypothetical protein